MNSRINHLIATIVLTAVVIAICWYIDYQTQEAESLAKYWTRLEQEQINLTNLLHNQK